MKSAIYSPYLDTFGGGERYILTIAEYLQTQGQVDILWDKDNVLPMYEKRFHLDLSKSRIVPNFFTLSMINRISDMRQYDTLVYLSDGSFPYALAKNNVLHLQIPFQLAHARTIKNKIKLSSWQHIVCNSQFTKKYVDQTYGINSDVLYPPVDIDEFSSKQKENLIITVGRFKGVGQWKKQDVLIKAFTKLCSEGLQGWRFALAGSIENQAYYDQLIKQAEGYPIDFYGNVDFAELKDLYARSSFYWHAQGFEETDPQYEEHFGITTVEAMAAGCVPLVFNAGGQKEIISNNKNGLLWNTIDELCHLTKQLIDQSSEQERLRKEAMESSKQFSKEAFLKQLVQIIEK